MWASYHDLRSTFQPVAEPVVLLTLQREANLSSPQALQLVLTAGCVGFMLLPKVGFPTRLGRGFIAAFIADGRAKLVLRLKAGFLIPSQ